MKYKIVRKQYNIGLIALAFATAAFWFATSSSQPVSARDGSVTFISDSVFGMTLDQSARVCIGTLDPRGPVLDWLVRFSDQNGALLLELPEQRSPADQWRCANVARTMLAVTGDAGTGRAQVAMEIVVKGPAGTESSQIDGSAEIIAAMGKTEAYIQVQFKKVLVSGLQ